jgi:hypothetical protein
MGGYSTFKKPTANLWPFSILSGPHSAWKSKPNIIMLQPAYI